MEPRIIGILLSISHLAASGQRRPATACAAIAKNGFRAVIAAL